MVRVSFLENENKTYRFMIENTEPEYLNALRRIIGYRLPIYAIDDIDFFENKNGEFILNELNTACGLIIHEKVSGIKIHEHISDYLIEEGLKI